MRTVSDFQPPASIIFAVDYKYTNIPDIYTLAFLYIEAYKKVEILDRIKLQLGWIQQGCYLVVNTCTEHLAELGRYSWDEEKDKPEDRNDHTINASQYAWIPYRQMVGFEVEE